MVTGTYSDPAEDEYFTVENMHCCISSFREDTDTQRKEWLEDFNDISLSDCSALSRLGCLREGSVLAFEIDGSYHLCRVEYLEPVGLSDEQERLIQRDIVGIRRIAVIELLDPHMDPLLVDIFQKEDLRNGMSVRSRDLTILDFEQQMDSLDDFDRNLLNTESLENTTSDPQLFESRLRVVDDDYIIDIFNLEADIVADNI